MKAALEIIPARKSILVCDGAGHDLSGKEDGNEVALGVAKEFVRFVAEEEK